MAMVKYFPCFLINNNNNAIPAILEIKQNENNNVDIILNNQKTSFEQLYSILNIHLTKKYIQSSGVEEFQKIWNFLDKNFKAVQKKYFLNPENMKNFLKDSEIHFQTVKYYFYTDEELEKMNRFKKISFNLKGPNSAVETTMAFQNILNRPLLLYGTSGSGKTTGIRNFCEKNNINLKETVISTKENFKEAIFGKTTIETDENGKTIIKKINATGFESMNEIRNNKNPCALLLDEVNRTEESLKEFTMFSPVYNYKEKGDFYIIEGEEELQILLVENFKKEKGIILMSKFSERGIDYQNNILKVLPENIKTENIEEANGCGNVSVVTEKFLKEKNLNVIKTFGKINDKIIVPVSAFKVIATANIGNNYDTARLDTATIQRCISCNVSSYKIYSGKEILLNKKESPVTTSLRYLTNEEKNTLNKFLENFSIIWGSYVKNGQIPKSSYNERLFSTFEHLDMMPEKIKIGNTIKKCDLKIFIKELMTNYLVSNFIETENGNEDIEINENQLILLESAINESFDSINYSMNFNYDIEKEKKKKTNMKKSLL